jgi:O-acetyl-ADP-ribose deacetylase (regulator of RNase III)
MELTRLLDGKVIVMIGDLTKEDTDAIVNAANSSLMGGGGVDGAIHRAGGPQIKAECKRIIAERYPGGLPTGEAVITTGGNLPARHVIHTVGPVYGTEGGREPQLLMNAYRNSLVLAAEYLLTTIAFPSISTGVYSYPKDEAANVASTAIGEFLTGESPIQQVRLVFFRDSDADIFLANCRF